MTLHLVREAQEWPVGALKARQRPLRLVRAARNGESDDAKPRGYVTIFKKLSCTYTYNKESHVLAKASHLGLGLRITSSFMIEVE